MLVRLARQASRFTMERRWRKNVDPRLQPGGREKISWADVDHPISKNHLGINLKSEDGPTYNSCLKCLKVYHISQLVHKHLQ